MLDTEGLDRVQCALADAAVDSAAWSRALDLIVGGSNAFGAVLLPLAGRAPGTALTRSLEPLVDDYFARGWGERDQRMRAMPKLVRTGIAVDQDVFVSQEMGRDPYWLDFLERHGVRWFAGLRVDAGDDVWCLALQRTPEQGPVVAEEQAALLRLAAPLSRAATLARRLGEAHLSGLSDALHLLGVPAMILDRQARVVRVNSATDQLLTGGLTLRRGELIAPNRPDISADLKRHFEAVVRANVALDSPYLAGIPIPRLGQRPLFVQAHPLRRALVDLFSPGRALVLVTAPDRAPLPSRGVLQALFSLTDSEARLVQALAEGRSLTDSAARIGVTYETARSYLKTIFAKTGARGQSELAVLATRIGRV